MYFVFLTVDKNTGWALEVPPLSLYAVVFFEYEKQTRTFFAGQKEYKGHFVSVRRTHGREQLVWVEKLSL